MKKRERYGEGDADTKLGNRSGMNFTRHEAPGKFASPHDCANLRGRFFPDPALAQAPLVPVGHCALRRAERPGPLVMHRPSSDCAEEKGTVLFSLFRISTSLDLS